MVGVAVRPGMLPLADAMTAAVDGALAAPAGEIRARGARRRIPEALDRARDATRPQSPP